MRVYHLPVHYLLTLRCRSLDPQTTYRTANEARFDFSNGSLEEQQASALGNIARPDDFIQFFITGSEKQPNPPKRPDGHASSLVIGTIPSTIDDIASSVSSTPGNAEHNETSLMGHFGAVSESGIYLDFDSLNEWTASSTPEFCTKVDIPYSYFCKTFSPERPNREGIFRRVPT